MSPIAKAELLFDNVDFCVWVINDIMENSRASGRQHLWRAPVVASMKGCWLKAKGAAKEFWLAVRDETGATPNTPDRKLAKFLILAESRVGGGNKTNTPKRYKITSREFYAKSITAWNARRAQESTNLNYYIDAKLPTAK